MNGTLWRLGVIAVASALAVGVFFAWRGAQREQAELKQELKTTQAQLADAAARQQQRDAKVGQLIDQLTRKKNAVKTPAQAVAALPEVLPLPLAIGISSTASDGEEASDGAKQGEKRQVESNPQGSRLPSVPLPIADLKPLYDFAVDCKACKARLAASQADLKDEQTKTAALERERDDALRAARGGSVIRRIVRAAKWFAIGAAAGAIAAHAAR